MRRQVYSHADGRSPRAYGMPGSAQQCLFPSAWFYLATRLVRQVLPNGRHVLAARGDRRLGAFFWSVAWRPSVTLGHRLPFMLGRYSLGKRQTPARFGLAADLAGRKRVTRPGSDVSPCSWLALRRLG